MSKSLGNYVSLNDSPADMFGKLMSISDELMVRYYDVLLHETIPAGTHPMEAKKSLARRIVARFHSDDEAAHALAARTDVVTRRDDRDPPMPKFD